MNFTNKVIERKHISSGRTEVLFRDAKGKLRLGRTFPSVNPEEAGALLKVLQEFRERAILVPDRYEEGFAAGTNCFSMPWDRNWTAAGPWPPAQLISLLQQLHRKGWLHLDINSGSFRNIEGSPTLLLWGDALLTGLVCVPPEIESGAPPSPLSDMYMLGRTMIAGRDIIWDGSDESTAEDLVAVSSRIRSAALRYTTSPEVRFRKGEVTFLTGSTWQIRDSIVTDWATEGVSKGWLVKVIRCNPREVNMPMPGYESVLPVTSGAAMINALFPSMSGVERLLIIDQVEFASPDLLEIVRDFQILLPPGLTVVVTAGKMPVAGFTPGENRIELEGPISSAWDTPLGKLKKNLPGTGFPYHSISGAGYRHTGAGPLPAPVDTSPEKLLAAGGYLALINNCEAGKLVCSSSALAKAYFEKGFYDRVLEIAPDDDRVIRASALLALGRKEETAALLKNTSKECEKLLRATALIEMMRTEEAVDILKSVPGADAALLLTKSLDMLGRTAEALPVIEAEISASNEQQKVRLLCSKTVLLMRTALYRDALTTAEEAVKTARNLFDPSLLWQSLTERGRVREVTGNWGGAVDDYRLALLYYAENPGRKSRPPLIDLFVLELRTGELKSAERSFKNLDVRLERSGSTIPPDQMTEMLSAYRAVVLGLGAMGIPSARRSAALAAEGKLTLVHALSLLYLGQLLLQEDRYDEGLEALEHARARAGVMGDRHLVLLADLAMTRAGVEIDPGRLVREACELGLKPEELEAGVISSGSSKERDRTFLEILNMPAPLLACELASSFGLPEDPVIRRRVLDSFTDIAELLSETEAVKFRESNNTLQRILDHREKSVEMPALEGASEKLAEWITCEASGEEALAELAKELGLDSISSTPLGTPGEEKLSSSPDLYARGSDLTPVRLLAPVIAAIAGTAPADGQKSSISGVDHFPEIIGISDSVNQLKDTMYRVASMPVPILITGETGTGKELVARGLHQKEKPTRRPFVALDCGAIAESILESELFGVTKGAYTGAGESRVGLLEAASGGTLFLDEIGNMPVSLQVKLLRVLETGKLRRLGDTAERTTSFRLLSATNSDLRKESSTGSFRMDLFYRIAVMELRVPPLRERLDDIPLLANHFTKAIHPGKEFSRNAMNRLMGSNWPGNIRELRNVVQRAVLLARGNVVKPEDVSVEVSSARPGSFQLEALDTATAKYVAKVVETCGGNKTEASRVLQCDPKTVRKYLALHKSAEEQG